MKYCEEYAALLDPFADGELPPDEMEQVRAHLETCPGCRAYVDDILAIRAGFPGVEDTEAPEGFAEGVMERIREDVGKDGKIVELKRRSVRRWAGSLAALAACCGLVILLRTGYGGGISDSMTTDAGASPADAPVEETGISFHMEEASETEAASASDAAPAEAPESNAAPSEEEQKRTAGQSEPQMAARSGDAVSNDAAMDTAAPAEPGKAAAYDASAALPETVEAAVDDTETEPALRLTRGEAGDLLDGYEPIWENAGERCYALSTEEYRALLEALGRPDAPEGAGETFTVLVVESPGE